MNYKIVSKYIKDVSFEIAEAKSYFLLEKNIKNYTFVCDIKSKSIRDKIIQIDVSLRLEPLDKNSDKNVYVSVELSSIIQIEGEVKKDELEKIVLIKVPTTVYPEIRNILIFLFEKSGFNKINIDHKIDFSKLYENRKNQK
tara:strand:+ start:4078 stop:4500 length:423 start_codon:yes stop_codon:yes gene_type:complete